MSIHSITIALPQHLAASKGHAFAAWRLTDFQRRELDVQVARYQRCHFIEIERTSADLLMLHAPRHQSRGMRGWFAKR